MSFPLVNEKQLISSLKKLSTITNLKLTKQIGVISCRNKSGAYLFMALLGSKLNEHTYWNESTDSIYYRYTPKVEIEFKNECIYNVKINGINYALEDINLFIFN